MATAIPMRTPTPWEVGRDQVESADTFWISTVRPDGSAAYADIDSGVAVFVMRNRIVGDMSAVAAIDRIIAAGLS